MIFLIFLIIRGPRPYIVAIIAMTEREICNMLQDATNTSQQKKSEKKNSKDGNGNFFLILIHSKSEGGGNGNS